MKSDMRTFVLSAAATASKRPTVTTELNRNKLFRFKAAHLFLLLRLVGPMRSFASELYCPSVNGGFGTSGTTFVGSGSAVPEQGKYTPWSGPTKAASRRRGVLVAFPATAKR
jgi:hypothetical protein